MKAGDTFEHTFAYSQAQVAAFAEVSGDANPIHLDPDYAAQTPFKRPIIHGMLGASIFTRLMGMEFPGPGAVYLEQSIVFKRPMFVDTNYTAKLEVLETDERRHTARVATKVVDSTTGKVTIDGAALIMHREKI
jgi:acyl dehydratase